MNKKLLELFMISELFHNGYSDFEFDEFAMDPLVNDCLMNLYISLLMNDSNPKKDEYFDKSVTLYRSFDEEKQEYVRNEIIKILKAQDENQKQKKKER